MTADHWQTKENAEFLRGPAQPNRAVAWLKTTIASDRKQTKKVDIGWTREPPDGKKIFFLDGSRIMEAQIGGAAHPFYVSPSSFGELTSTSRGQMIASLQSLNTQIWVLPLNAHGLKASGKSYPILSSSASQSHARFSPDGRYLAFSSTRSGGAEVWLADSDGKNPRQLTHKSFYIVGYIRWSSDSQMVAFHARLPDDPQVYIARIADGLVRQVTYGKPGFMGPSWASDGLSLYADALERGANRTYRIPMAGGVPQLLVEGGAAIEVPSRNLLIYEKEDQSGIYCRSLTGDIAANQERLLVEDYEPRWGGFYPVDDGIYYGSLSSLHRAFRFYHFDSGAAVDIAPQPINLHVGLTVAPDRTRLVYSTYSERQDLVQIEYK